MTFHVNRLPLHMKYQVVFSLKSIKKNSRMSSATIWRSALRISIELVPIKDDLG